MDGSSHAIRAVAGEYRLKPMRGLLIAEVVIASTLTVVYAALDELSTTVRALVFLYLWTSVVLDISRAVRRPVETVITTDGVRLRRWGRWRELPWTDVVRIDPDEALRIVDPKAHRVRVTRRSGPSVLVKGLTPEAAAILVAASRGRSPEEVGARG